MAVIMAKNLLRAWREDRGWTLDEVSGLTGVSVSYLSLAERGQREVAPATRVQIARGVGARVADLFPVNDGSPAYVNDDLTGVTP
jgi:transcriptional regulator with XRE-family HTH domain